jgi:hypothetical protein
MVSPFFSDDTDSVRFCGAAPNPVGTSIVLRFQKMMKSLSSSGWFRDTPAFFLIYSIYSIPVGSMLVEAEREIVA